MNKYSDEIEKEKARIGGNCFVLQWGRGYVVMKQSEFEKLSKAKLKVLFRGIFTQE